MGWFDRKIYFYFQHSHALTAFTLSLLSRVCASARTHVLFCHSLTRSRSHALTPRLPVLLMALIG